MVVTKAAKDAKDSKNAYVHCFHMVSVDSLMFPKASLMCYLLRRRVKKAQPQENFHLIDEWYAAVVCDPSQWNCITARGDFAKRQEYFAESN